MARITKAEKIQRVKKVFSLLLMGAKRAEICQYAAKSTNWNVSDRMIDRYIAAATEKIHESSEDDIAYERALMKERLDDLYKKNMGKKDLRAALLVLKQRSDLLGLDAPKRTDITSDGEKIAQIIKVGVDSDKL